MWPMGRAVVFVASAIADFPTHPPKDFKFLYNTSIMYKPVTFFVISSLKHKYAVCVSFDFAIKVRRQSA